MLTHWSYCSLALNHQYVVTSTCSICTDENKWLDAQRIHFKIQMPSYLWRKSPYGDKSIVVEIKQSWDCLTTTVRFPVLGNSQYRKSYCGGRTIFRVGRRFYWNIPEDISSSTVIIDNNLHLYPVFCAPGFSRCCLISITKLNIKF